MSKNDNLVKYNSHCNFIDLCSNYTLFSNKEVGAERKNLALCFSALACLCLATYYLVFTILL